MLHWQRPKGDKPRQHTQIYQQTKADSGPKPRRYILTYNHDLSRTIHVIYLVCHITLFVTYS